MPTLLQRLRRELARVADPARAPKMQAYMKSAMPYHGVASPIAKRVYKEVLATVELPDAGTWRGEVLALWTGARFREERYAAIALTGDRRARPFQTLDALPLYERLIVEGAWWDYVDELAIHRVGPLLAAFPEPMRRTLLAWSEGEDMWRRRTAIIAQNAFKTETDLDLLYACIEPSLGSKEFFLRKAIGWALRQYAWTDPREVARYVERMADRLSPLSRREALKNVS